MENNYMNNGFVVAELNNQVVAFMYWSSGYKGYMEEFRN